MNIKVRPISGEAMADEYRRVLLAMIAIIEKEDKENTKLTRGLELLSDSIEKLAALGEKRVEKKLLLRIKRDFVRLLRGSTNKLLIAAVNVTDN